MTRPIKFRAWDSKKMYPSDEVIVYLGMGWLENISLDAKVIHVKDTPPLTLMQFTGLTDKNGKEIYEGDVVCGADGGNWIVKWNLSPAGFVIFAPEDQEKYFGLRQTKSDLEIVGNIYENPELLK